MKRIIYEVHSDENENNLFATFYGKGAKQAAIRYAKDNKDEKTWVDKVQYDTCTEDYQYLGGVWNYSEEE